MISDIIVATISAVIGAVIGWILSSIDRGQVDIAFRNEHIQMVYDENTQKALWMEVVFRLCAYNKSQYKASIRESSLLLITKNKHEKIVVGLYQKGEYGSLDEKHEVRAIMIDGKTDCIIDLSALIPAVYAFETERVYFQYTDKRLRTKRILMGIEPPASIYRKDMTEEGING